MVKTKGRCRKKRTKTRKRRGGGESISAETLKNFFHDNKIVQNMIKMRFPNENMPRFFEKLNDDEVQKTLNDPKVQKIYKKITKCFSMTGGSKKKMKGGNAELLGTLLLLYLSYQGIGIIFGSMGSIVLGGLL